MRLGINHRTGKTQRLTSWLSNKVPAMGAFTFEWEPNRQELVIKKRGKRYWSSGPLRSNDSFENFELKTGLQYGLLNISNANGDYFTYMAAEDSRRSTSSPAREQFSKWKLDYEGKLIEECNGIGIEGVMCDGYNTKMGCVRRDNAEHTCRGRARLKWRSGSFIERGGREVLVDNGTLSISDCMDMCWKDCKCAGICAECYDGGSNTECKFWYGELLLELESELYEKHYVIIRGGEKWPWISVSVVVIVVLTAIGVIFYLAVLFEGN